MARMVKCFIVSQKWREKSTYIIVLSKLLFYKQAIDMNKNCPSVHNNRVIKLY